MPLSWGLILANILVGALFIGAAVAAVIWVRGYFWPRTYRKQADDWCLPPREVAPPCPDKPPDLLPPAARHSAPNEGPRYAQGPVYMPSWKPADPNEASGPPPPSRYSAREKQPSISIPLEIIEEEEEKAKTEEAVEPFLFAVGKTAEHAALEYEAGRLAYQIPDHMWRGVEETVQVQLGTAEAQGVMTGFMGRGEVKAEDVPIVETMSVSLLCERNAFQIVHMCPRDQLVKPDMLKGTPFHKDDFGKWVWLVTPKKRGAHKLLVKVAASLKDSRGLPATSSLPDKIFEVTVRVQVMRSIANALWRAVPSLLWVIVTTLVGIFTKDYWWPFVRDFIGLY